MKNFYLFFLITLSLVKVNSQTSLQFCLKQINYTGIVYNTPRGITSGDFNGDGKIDLVTANQGANKISLLPGTGTGSFGVAQNYSVGANPWGVASADFNGDGKPDLAVANEIAGNISVLLNTGGGSFAAASNFTVTNTPREIISVDFNGDGHADLATTYMGGNDVGVLLGTGTGSFGTTINYPVGSSPWGIISRDFNGDGKPDIATANWGGNNVSVLLGTGTGSFNSGTNFPAGNSPQGITSSDFNGDGNPDLAIANFALFGGSNIAVLLGNGAGGFGATTYFGAGLNLNVLTSLDFNGDGNQDLAALDFGGGMMYMLQGTGTGSFVPAINLAHGNSSGIISSDLNGDGKPDLASSYTSGHGVTILLNEPPPTLTITGNKSVLCSGELLTFTASGGYGYVWNSSGVPTHTITGNNSASFIASSNATYAVTGLSAATGCSTTAIAEVSITACAGIDLTQGQRLLKVFPNPATNEIAFDLSIEEKVTLEIYDQKGQLVSQSENCSGLLRYDVSNLVDSIYFYKITGKNNFYSGKFYKTGN